MLVCILQQMRRDLLSRLDTARQNQKALKVELEVYGAADPIKFAEKKRAVQLAKEASLLWTGANNLGETKLRMLTFFLLVQDNTMILFKMAKDTLGVECSDLRQHLGIGKRPCRMIDERIAD
jgi:hypothetical protein